jgi:hypothetical protein
VVLEYGRYVGRPDDEEALERGLYHDTLFCYDRSIQRVNSPDILLRGR